MSEKVEVIQADIDAAAAFDESVGGRMHVITRQELAVAFARRRLESQLKVDDSTVERVAQGIADAQFGGPFNGLEWPEAWDHFERLARAAISSLVGEGADLAAADREA